MSPRHQRSLLLLSGIVVRSLLWSGQYYLTTKMSKNLRVRVHVCSWHIVLPWRQMSGLWCPWKSKPAHLQCAKYVLDWQRFLGHLAHVYSKLKFALFLKRLFRLHAELKVGLYFGMIVLSVELKVWAPLSPLNCLCLDWLILWLIRSLSGTAFTVFTRMSRYRLSFLRSGVASFSLPDSFPVKLHYDLHLSVDSTFPGKHILKEAWNCYQRKQIMNAGFSARYRSSENRGSSRFSRL